MADPKIKYDIEADVKGDARAEDLARVLRQVSDVLEKDLKQDALAAADALQTLSEKQAALDSLSKLSAEASAMGTALQVAQSKADQLGTQLAETADRAEAFAATEARARTAVEAKSTELERAQAALRQLRLENTGAARSTDEYKQSSAALTAEVQRLGAELAIDRAALRDMAAQTREAEREQRGLAAQYDKSVGALQKSGAAQEQNATSMATARQAAERLGLTTTNLQQQEAALAKAVDEKRAAFDAAKAGVERLRESQARAAQVAQEFQAEVRKLGIDGAQAPAALEAAFRQLGISGVKPAEAAVHQLQIALAQIRNSPDVLPADKQAAVAAFNQKVAELRAEAGRAATATAQLGTASQGTGNALATAAHKAVAWTSALVGLQQLKSLAAQVIDTGATFETLQVRLENLLGSTQSANQAFGMIKTLAASTPFEVAGLTESFIKLTAMGMQPTEAQMRSLADVAANLGGGTEVLSGVTLALGQAWAKGKLQGEELLQLAERGVPVWDALARATGRSVPELQRMSEAGILGRDVIAKLIDELGRMNEGASDKLMNTYAGAVANAKDALAEFFDMIAKSGALDWLTGKVRELLAEFDRMKQNGELQAKAKELSDAFISIASGAETAARAIMAMAPAIQLAATMFVGMKIAGMGASLLGMATGATTAATAMGAAGTAARVATPAIGGAALAARGLALAIRLIPGAALFVALGEAAAFLAGKFLGPKKAAEDAGKALDALVAPRPDNGAEKAAEAAAQALQEVPRKADDALKAFDRFIEKGDQTSEALNKIGKDFDLSNAEGIKNAAVVLDSLLAQGKITAQQFNEAWSRALKDVDLSDFENRARAAMTGAWEGVGRLGQALDAGLREAIRRSGADFEVLSGGMGRAARSAIADVDTIIAGLDRLEAQGVDAGLALAQSLGKAISTADSQAAIDALRGRVEALREKLGDKVADGLLDQARQKAEELKAALDQATPGITSVAEAMKRLGLESTQSLQRTASEAQQAYDVIAKAGAEEGESYLAWQRRKETAALAMIQRMIEANRGIVDANISARAAAAGLKVEVDESGRTIVRSMRDAKGAVDDLHRSTRGAAGGFGDMGQSAQQAAEAVKRLREIQQRQLLDPGDPEKSPLQNLYDRYTLDGKDSKDAIDASRKNVSGNAAILQTDINQQIADRYGEEFIGNAKAEAAFQRRLELENYRKNYGNVARSQQSLNEQRNIAAELERLEREIEAERQAALRGTTAAPGTRAPAPTPAPADRTERTERSGSSSGMSVGSTIVNLNVDTRNFGSVPTNAQGARNIEAMIRALADAKSVSR